jgi:hypothetical protein
MTNKENVEQLITKAAKAEKSEDAMRFSQAACNAANAICALRNAESQIEARAHAAGVAAPEER